MSTPDVARSAIPKLDLRERHYRLPSHREGLGLFLRHLPPLRAGERPRAVLYVHGATFPSALSIAHRFDRRSWRDALCDAGFDVWGLDFLGFGLSDTYVERFVLFGPIAARPGTGDAPRLPAWKDLTVKEQRDRFVADTPEAEAPVLLERHFRPWGETWLDTDPLSRARAPAAVRVPLGPLQDIHDAWNGSLAWDPAMVRTPVAILRGEWDSLCTDADARWLWDALAVSSLKRDVKLSRSGHLMHLEEGRHALWRETLCFLQGTDEAPLHA